MVRWLLGVCLAYAASLSYACDQLYFGVVPESPPKQARQTWAPLVELLNLRLSCPIYLKLTNDPAEFAQAIQQGEYGLAYLDNVYLELAQTSAAYTALTGTHGIGMEGVILVHRDDPAQTIYDLSQPTIELAATTEFAVSQLIQAELERIELSYTEQFVVSQEQVYLNLARRINHVGAGNVSSLAMTPPDVRRHLRIIWRFPDAANHYIATHPKMDTGYRNELLQALLDLGKTSQGKHALSKLHSKGFYVFEHSTIETAEVTGSH